MTRRALITGVTGQDGHYLAALLQAEGTAVVGMVRAGDPEPAPAGVELVEGDLADAAAVRSAVRDARPDEVYNLAGVSSVGLSWERPELTLEVTGLGLLRVIEAVRSLDRPVRLVQASSAEIFGHTPAPQDETTPLAPVNPYGAAKALGQHLVGLYRSAGVECSTAILFNHESPRRPVSFVTRKITHGVAAIAQGRADDLVMGNLDARRDWGFAGDYARALRLIARHGSPDDFVIASGVSRSVADFVAAAFAHVGITDWQAHVRVDPALVRPNDPGEQRGDAGKARRVLGWAPSVGFEQMVADMVDADLGVAASSRRG